MKVIEQGHTYLVDRYDGHEQVMDEIVFMKREGPGYPNNVGSHPGTNCQELIRVLIDRIKYLDGQIPSHYNSIALAGLRAALVAFEVRAAERHGRELKGLMVDSIEYWNACKTCGHIQCGGHS